MARHRSPDQRPLSAIPPRAARAVAFVTVLLGGLIGGVLGHTVVAVQCSGDCSLPNGLGLLAGSIVTAAGMAVVAVLALRAMGEWHEILDRERAGHAP
jgi:hypothetical protein